MKRFFANMADRFERTDMAELTGISILGGIVAFLLMLMTSLLFGAEADPINPIEPGPLPGFVVDNIGTLIAALMAIIEIFLRLAPTGSDLSILNKILKVLRFLDKVVPNRNKNKERGNFTVAIVAEEDLEKLEKDANG